VLSCYTTYNNKNLRTFWRYLPF